ncbi:MAG: MFS transporter [Dehalococcoidia bacterium]|nr:MFS transporter [Dehalococcoidia bacterium]
MKEASSEGALKRPNRVFYGWWIVVIGLITSALKHGTFNRGFTIYILPIQNSLGIDRTAISLAETLGRLEGGLHGPVVGYLTDRFGGGALMAAGGLISGLGFILVSFTHNYLYFMLVYVGLISLGVRAGYENASIPAVNQWFRRKRSLAMALVSAGQGLGCAAIPPLLGVMVFSLGLGWRTSALVSGVAILAIVVPLSFLVRRSPESMGLLPDGARPDVPLSSTSQESGAGEEQGRKDMATPQGPGPTTVGTPADRVPGEADFTTKEALRTRSYWLLVLAVGLRNSVHAGMSFHLAPLMVWSGVSEPTAAIFVGLMCFGILAFNPCAGWMGDRWSKQRISAVAMVSGILAVVMMLYSSGQLWQLAVFITFLAFSESANPLACAILGDFFGRRSFATLRGWQHLPDQLMSMLTPLWMGWIFVHTDESYFWALIPIAVMYGLSAFFYWTIPRPEIPARLANPQSPIPP